MDKLKQILKQSKPTSKIIQQKAVIAEKQKQFELQQREEKAQEQENKEKKLKEIQDFYEYDIKRKKIKITTEVQESNLDQLEVKKRLRTLHQPITLFAQTDIERYQRMLKVEQFYKNNPNFDMKTYDEQFQLRLKEQEEFNELDAKYRDRLIEPRLGDDPQYIEKKMDMIVKDKEDTPFQNMCDQIFLWTHKVLRDWNQALEQKYNNEQAREKSKDSWARYYESYNDARSFLSVLKRRGGDKQMIQSIYHIMNCCLVRQYIQANDKYLELSIGNAPWPLGVAMLGITVRRNAPKVSHVLNQQLSRKWMQAIKRFISVSQQIYPSEQDYKKVGYSIKSMI